MVWNREECTSNTYLINYLPSRARGREGLQKGVQEGGSTGGREIPKLSRKPSRKSHIHLLVLVLVIVIELEIVIVIDIVMM